MEVPIWIEENISVTLFWKIYIYQPFEKGKLKQRTPNSNIIEYFIDTLSIDEEKILNLYIIVQKDFLNAYDLIAIFERPNIN